MNISPRIIGLLHGSGGLDRLALAPVPSRCTQHPELQEPAWNTLLADALSSRCSLDAQSLTPCTRLQAQSQAHVT